MANSVDLDETACDESSHLVLNCLQMYVLVCRDESVDILFLLFQLRLANCKIFF